jgi:putative glutamine amidotransferase
MKPIIGIPCGSTKDTPWSPPMHGHRQTYIDAVVQAGGVPFLIPLVDDEEVLRTLYNQLDGLLLAGGGDIAPSYYGEEPHENLGSVDELRDRVEIPLTRWAVADGKPVLGICRGIQMLNVALGGTLYQDIGSQLANTSDHRDSMHKEDWSYMAHGLSIDPESKLASMLGVTVFQTNSLHHQAVKDVAPGLRAVGWAPDGVIEALEGTGDQFIVGVQCHPEALQAETDPRWRGMFRAFVESCKHPEPAVA